MYVQKSLFYKKKSLSKLVKNWWNIHTFQDTIFSPGRLLQLRLGRYNKNLNRFVYKITKKQNVIKDRWYKYATF